MTVFFSRDNSFFDVVLTDYSGESAIAQKDIISITISESADKLPSGSIQLYDPTMFYSKILRTGVSLLISWGYKKMNAILEDWQAGADEFTNSYTRRGFKAMVVNPSGNAGDNGIYTYSANFAGMDWIGKEGQSVALSGTKGSVIAAVMQRMGIALPEVNIEQMNQAYSSYSVERQAETDFAFLARLAWECDAFFIVGYDSMGNRIGAFLKPQACKDSPTLKAMTGNATGKNIYSWGNMASMPNVISYSWQNAEGENGAGDNVKMVMVGGTMVMQRFTIENEQVITWELDPEKVKEYDRTTGIADKGAALASVLNIEDFRSKESLKFFRQVDRGTAPNGIGYSVDLHCFGNPSIGVGMNAVLAEGFPPCLVSHSGRLIQWIVREVSHSLSSAGYFTDVKIVDMLSISPTGLRI